MDIEIISAERANGFQVALKGEKAGEIYKLPPWPSHFYPPAPGLYRLRSTGEEISGPDFTTSRTINPPPDEET